VAVSVAACSGGGSSNNSLLKNGVVTAGSELVLTPSRPLDGAETDKAAGILRTRLRDVGVKTFTVTARDGNLVVDIGARDKAMTPGFDVVKPRGQFLLRPVLQELGPDAAGQGPPSTPPEHDDAGSQVVLGNRTGDARYVLGPAGVTGAQLASVTPQPEKVTGTTNIQFKLTSEGTRAFNDMAARIGVGKKLAIDIDGQVVAAPTLQTTQFEGSGNIPGDFTAGEAATTAVVLSAGALPAFFTASHILPFTGRS
jgi:preprotein translocase subunit SecD